MTAEAKLVASCSGTACARPRLRFPGGLTAGDLGAYVEPPALPPEASQYTNAFRTGDLDGMSVPIKDNIDLIGWPTGAGCAVPSEPAVADAEVVGRLRSAGATLDAKTALDEFAFTTFGPGMRNPYDLDRSVGGSSGGSALAVAAGECCVAIGTDTGGSVRIPASYCGVVGFKPTHGLIPTDGVLPLSWTLDHVGFLGCSTETVTRVFDACRDSRPAGRPDVRRHWPRQPSELRIGIADEASLRAATPEVAEAVREVAEMLHALGASTEAVALPDVRTVLDNIHYPIAAAEAATYHTSRYDNLDQHSESARGVIEAGLAMSAPSYVRTLHGLDELRADFATLMYDIDVVLLPTTPTPAPHRNSPSVRLGDGQEVDPLDASIWYTSYFNDVGAPAISLPISGSSLPIGVQLAAAPYDDDLLLSIAGLIEATGLYSR